MSPVTVRTSKTYVGRRHVEVVHISHDETKRIATSKTKRATLPPVVFLHGWSLSGPALIPILKPFAVASGRDVYAMSLPGFGASDPLPVRRQNVVGAAEQIAAAIEALGLDCRVAVAGHSFGGGVALRLGATRPDLVDSLTLFCPVGGAPTDEDRPSLTQALVSITADSFHRWTPRAGVQAVIPNLVHHPLAFAVSGVAAWASDQIHDAHAVSAAAIPTAFLFAEKDNVVKPGAIATAHLPGVDVQMLPGRHSWLMAEPERFIRTLMGCLRDHERVANLAHAIAID